MDSRGVAVAVATLSILTGCTRTTTTPAATTTEKVAVTATSTIVTTTNMPKPNVPARPAVSEAQLDRTSYIGISQHDFLLVMKDPDAHVGEQIIIVGKVTQFDSQTGPDQFRADVMGQPGGKPAKNALIQVVDPSILANIAEGEDLTMYVAVAGTDAEQTPIGGQSSVPKFTAYIVEPFHRK